MILINIGLTIPPIWQRKSRVGHIKNILKYFQRKQKYFIFVLAMNKAMRVLPYYFTRAIQYTINMLEFSLNTLYIWYCVAYLLLTNLSKYLKVSPIFDCISTHMCTYIYYIYSSRSCECFALLSSNFVSTFCVSLQLFLFCCVFCCFRLFCLSFFRFQF